VCRWVRWLSQVHSRPSRGKRNHLLAPHYAAAGRSRAAVRRCYELSHGSPAPCSTDQPGAEAFPGGAASFATGDAPWIAKCRVGDM
jgi:hypothetical protein